MDSQIRNSWRWAVETENTYQHLQEGPLRNAIDAVWLIEGNDSPIASYALVMGRRLAERCGVLKTTGSLYLHCDHNANWLPRILLDQSLGSIRFQNEIVWQYRRGLAKVKFSFFNRGLPRPKGGRICIRQVTRSRRLLTRFIGMILFSPPSNASLCGSQNRYVACLIASCRATPLARFSIGASHRKTVASSNSSTSP